MKNLESYQKILGLKSTATRMLFKRAIGNVKSWGGLNIDKVAEHSESELYDMLQEWILWNNERGMAASSIKCYFTVLRSYLWYAGVKLDTRDISQNLKFPQTLHAQHVPATKEILQQILDASKPAFRLQLLVLISGGVRVGELGQIRPEHLDFSRDNAIVSLPAEITKTGRSRITFLSEQITEKIRKNPKPFCGDRTTEQARNLILKRFAVARKKVGIMDIHGHCKQTRYHIHVHSLRAYFITKANRVQFGLGHILAGHDFYMKQYNQYTNDELLEMYKKVEPELTFKLDLRRRWTR